MPLSMRRREQTALETSSPADRTLGHALVATKGLAAPEKRTPQNRGETTTEATPPLDTPAREFAGKGWTCWQTTTIEIGLVGDAILGRRPLPDALTWHCASSLQTSDTGREERKFHCGLHKAIQGTRRLAARLDERRHQCALLDLSQTIPHCGFAYLSRTARPTKDNSMRG